MENDVKHKRTAVEELLLELQRIHRQRRGARLRALVLMLLSGLAGAAAEAHHLGALYWP